MTEEDYRECGKLIAYTLISKIADSDFKFGMNFLRIPELVYRYKEYRIELEAKIDYKMRLDRDRKPKLDLAILKGVTFKSVQDREQERRLYIDFNKMRKSILDEFRSTFKK